MANEPLYLKRYPTLDDDLVVHIETFEFPANSDGTPFDEIVSAAYFAIKKGDDEKLQVALGEALQWNTDLKTLTLKIKNSDLDFADEGFVGRYELVVIYQSNRAETVSEDQVAIARGL